MSVTAFTLPYPVAHTVDSQGQLVIEKEIRKALKVEPGSVALQQLVGDHVEIRFYPAEHKSSLRGILGASRKRRIPPETWEDERHRAQAKAVRAEWRREAQDD